MKYCARCKQVIKDGETFCSRCGSTQFIEQRVNPQAQQTMTQGQPMRQQGMNQGQRPMQQTQGQRPMQNMNNNGINMQRPQQQVRNQNQQMQMNVNPNMMNSYNQQNMYSGNMNQNNINQNNGMQQQMNNSMQQQMNNGMQQQMNNGMQQMNNGYTPNDFVDAPVETKKKKLFKSKDAQQNGMNQQQINQNNQYQSQFDQSMAQQNGYQQVNTPDNSVVTTKDWIILMVCLIVPILNIIVIIKTLTNKSGNASKRNYIKAYLIWFIAVFVISLVFVGLFGAAIASMGLS